MKSPSTISRSVKCGLHFVGIWPGTPCPGLHKFCWVTFMAIFQTCQYKYVITHYECDSLIEMIDNLSIAMPFTLVCIKLVVAWLNHGVLSDILSTMEEDCQKYAVIDTNNLISKTSRLSYRLTSVVISLYGISVAFYLAGALTSQDTNGSTSRNLLLKVDLPFDTNESPIYELVVTAEFLHQVSSAITFGVFGALLLMVVLHVGCHIDIMCQALTDISRIDDKQLRFFVSRHQEIIVFTERIEHFFTYISLSQLVANTLITCCLGFVMVVAISEENGLPILIKSVMFYITICLEAFIYCFAGEYLNNKSKLIGDTAYNLLWYDLKPNESRLLILVILRSQKGFTLTFGKFSKLSYESFTQIMKASASYVSVLLAMS
ncbi:odorant receptor 67c-like [Andrena cerasifolii]|uniref:odorant receptor 67c-like n=1 Tax=Andrena cerasifolii TaxID=2819439 RepID=UPI004037FB58